jgi:MFS family permease
VANSPASSDQRAVWAFWLACVLAVVAGLSPFVFGGGSDRLGGAVVPFAVAAVALAACALLYSQGRPIATGLYFLASLAIVYGILALVAVPLRLAVLGTCPPAPAQCGAGLERPLTGAENTVLGFAVGIGVVAILTGFFGLVTLYRRLSPTRTFAPPARRIAPVSEKAPAAAAAATPVPAPAPQLEPEPEPAADAPQLELAAPVEALELPEVGTADPVEVAPPAPEPKPRRKRVPKIAPDTPTKPDPDASA